MSAHTFVVAGEALVDLVVPADGPRRPSPGGSPLNVAVGLARLGLDTLLLSELGDDDHGRMVADHARESAVVLHPATVKPGFVTSTATAYLDENRAATYDFDLRWTLAPQELPADATAVHVGSIGAVLRPGRDAVRALVADAASRGLLVSFDPNARPAITPDAEQTWRDVRELAADARVLKMSDEDLEFLQPGSTAQDLADALLGGATELVVVTFGGEGAAAFGKHGAVEVQGRPTDVVDTVGAGDSFMAALLAVVAEHGLEDLTPDRLRAYVEAANQAAAITVSRRGANPPTRAELPAGWPHL